MNHRAFTLTEMLSALLVVATFMAFQIPPWSHAPDKPRARICLNNLREISRGISQYLQDYDQTYPMSQYGGGSTGNPQVSWYAAIAPYVSRDDAYIDPSTGVLLSWGRYGIYACPSFPEVDQSGKYGCHHDLFPDFFNWPFGGNDARHRVSTVSDVDNPTEKIIVVEKGVNDASWGYIFFGTWEWDWVDPIGNPPQRDGANIALQRDCDLENDGDSNATWGGCGMMPRYRHSGVCNVIFADGHVDGMKRGEIHWYRNIFIRVGLPRSWAEQGWYPY